MRSFYMPSENKLAIAQKTSAKTAVTATILLNNPFILSTLSSI